MRTLRTRRRFVVRLVSCRLVKFKLLFLFIIERCVLVCYITLSLSSLKKYVNHIDRVVVWQQYIPRGLCIVDAETYKTSLYYFFYIISSQSLSKTVKLSTNAVSEMALSTTTSQPVQNNVQSSPGTGWPRRTAPVKSSTCPSLNRHINLLVLNNIVLG
jgi:hypothetical protein